MKINYTNHLRWIHDRIVHVYKENENIDFLIKFRSIIAELEALQQSNQCNTCNFYHSFTGVCANDKCPLCTDFVDADFGCIYHEAKEQ